MPHWRTMLQSEFLSAADLWVEDGNRYLEPLAKIVNVKAGELIGDGGKKKKAPFVWLEWRDGRAARAPLGLNATNSKSISSAAGSPDVRTWIGLWIKLYVTKVQVGRDMVDAIRIDGRAQQDPTKKAAPADASAIVPQDQLTDEDKRAIEAAERGGGHG